MQEPDDALRAWLELVGADEPQQPGTNVYESIDATERDLEALEGFLEQWTANRAQRLDLPTDHETT